jgi:hypothetical protein
MGLTLGCTNSMIDLKLGCMYIDIQKNISISFLIYMFLWLAIKNRLNTVPLIDWLCNWDPLCNNENFSTWIYIYIYYIYFFFKRKKEKKKKQDFVNFGWQGFIPNGMSFCMISYNI